MATSFWKRRLERLGEQFSNCEAIELSMIRDEKPVSDATHRAYLADLWSDAVRKAEIHDKAHIKGLKPGNCPRFGFGHGKIGSIFFYAPSLLMMPRVDASRIWEKLDEMFVAAGGVLESIPPAIAKQLNPLALTFTNRKIRWAACVFEAALQNLPGMTHAEMTYLDGQPCPGCWSATLENAMATSQELIDWLLVAADDTPAEANGVAVKAGGGASSTPARTSNAKPLRPSAVKAWSQYQHAVDQQPTIVTDDEAYGWLVDDAKDDGTPMPRRDSWKRSLRRAREFHGQQKNGPGIGNETHSVVSAKRLDSAKRTKADQR